MFSTLLMGGVGHTREKDHQNFSTLLMGGGGHTREKDHQNVKSLIIFAHDCRFSLLILCLFDHGKSRRGSNLTLRNRNSPI